MDSDLSRRRSALVLRMVAAVAVVGTAAAVLVASQRPAEGRDAVASAPPAPPGAAQAAPAAPPDPAQPANLVNAAPDGVVPDWIPTF